MLERRRSAQDLQSEDKAPNPNFPHSLSLPFAAPVVLFISLFPCLYVEEKKKGTRLAEQRQSTRP
jgi:hypothetical protein